MNQTVHEEKNTAKISSLNIAYIAVTVGEAYRSDTLINILVFLCSFRSKFFL